MIDFFLHLDKHLQEIITTYGTWTYLILFGIIFAETGLVVCPFLPGDSLLFAAGIFAHPERSSLTYWGLFLVLTTAAIAGDSTNYWIGRKFGTRLFHNPKSRIFKKDNLDKTHAFFEKHGARTVIFARFVPIIRTFAPFVAGLGTMEYPRFLLFSVTGSLLWVGVCLTAGYYFGSIPLVRDNFSIAMLSVVVVTCIPAIIEILRHKRKNRKKAAEE